MKRRTKIQKSRGQWTQVAQEILRHTSALCILLRDSLDESLHQVRQRLVEFQDAWVKSGEGDVLPTSGKNSDELGLLCDVDIIQFVVDMIDMRLDQMEKEND